MRIKVKTLLTFIAFPVLMYCIDCIGISSTTASANPSSHCDTLGGWHFYCDEKAKEISTPKPQTNIQEEKETEQLQSKQQTKTDEYYSTQMKNMRKNLDKKINKAILEPTPENVKDYIIEQQKVVSRASTFGDAWQRVIWQNPSLDYTLKRPVSKLGKETYLDTKKETQKELFTNLSKRYGIFYIFKSTCPYCHKYSPILKSFANKYNFKVSPVSIDGGYLPDFTQEETLINKGNLESLGIQIKAVPATILFDAKTRSIIEVGFGLLSVDELEERIYMLTSRKVGEDY